MNYKNTYIIIKITSLIEMEVDIIIWYIVNSQKVITQIHRATNNGQKCTIFVIYDPYVSRPSCICNGYIDIGKDVLYVSMDTIIGSNTIFA